LLAKKISEFSVEHLGVRKDLVASPLLHDTPDAMATPHGVVAKDAPLVPGVTMPKLAVVEPDYPAFSARVAALGPLTAKVGMVTKGVPFMPDSEVDDRGRRNGLVESGPTKGRPKLDTDVRACEMVLSLSGTTNGRLGTQGFQAMEKKTGQKLAH